MPDQVLDGGGRGFKADVNKDNQLVTRATAVEQRLKSTSDRLYYEATTGQITLANDTETGLIYLKNSNTSGKVIVVDRVFWDLWTSTVGTGADGTVRYYINPTYTGGSAITPVNTNFASSVEAQGTFLKSLTTIAGTVWWTGYVTDKTSFAIEEGRIIIPEGKTFGISFAAPTGNTSMKVSVNVAFYYLDLELL